jgi:hypothetical protein
MNCQSRRSLALRRTSRGAARWVGFVFTFIGICGVVAVRTVVAQSDDALADYVIPHEHEGDVNAKTAADIVAIDQIWSAYAHYLDSGDAEGVASLFSPTGGYVLGFANRATGQVETLGYSPSADGVSGTPGGGCTALGHDAIVNFLHGIGVTDTPNKFPGVSKHVVVDRWIHVDGDTATFHAYWLGGNPVSSRGLYNNTFVRTPHGWKAERNEVLFDTNNPTFTCRN